MYPTSTEHGLAVPSAERRAPRTIELTGREDMTGQQRTESVPFPTREFPFRCPVRPTR